MSSQRSATHTQGDTHTNPNRHFSLKTLQFHDEPLALLHHYYAMLARVLIGTL